VERLSNRRRNSGEGEDEMKMDEEQANRHHPFCAYNHDALRQGIDWRCECSLLKAYDKWRHNADRKTFQESPKEKEKTTA
jgi:hypothetical protein